MWSLTTGKFSVNYMHRELNLVPTESLFRWMYLRIRYLGPVLRHRPGEGWFRGPMMSPKPTAGDDARTNREAPTTEKRSASVDSWGPTESEVADGEIVITDGGIDTADELEHDPRSFSISLTPAIVEEVLEDDSVSKVSFANVQLRDCGALRWEEWSGAAGLLPEWRWSEVRYLDTERTERDGTKLMARICTDDWDRLPTVVQEVVDFEDDLDDERVITDGGTITVPNGGSPDRFPELVAFHRDILLTLARSQPTNGQGLLADLSTLRDEKIYGSRLYRNLGELVDAGLVDKEEFPNDDRAHEFQLSANGQQAIRGHAQRLEGAVEALNESN